MRDLSGKSAVVTGGASGIGFELGVAFARSGMNVALLDVDEERLRAAASQIELAGTRVETAVVDVSDLGSVLSAADRLRTRLGPLQVVANNAGVGLRSSILNTTPANFDWLMAVNVGGVFNVTQAFIKPLLDANLPGHMVVTASIASLVATPEHGNGVYAATKMAVFGIATYLKAELLERDIGVSVLCPGMVATDTRKSGEHRPGRFGGPFSRADGGQPRDGAMDPAHVARLVLHAIETDVFLIGTHPLARSMIVERNRVIVEQIDMSARLLEELKIPTSHRVFP